MTHFTIDIEGHYPTTEEVETALRAARRLRAETMSAGLTSFWAMAQRAITRNRKPVQAKPA